MTFHEFKHKWINSVLPRENKSIRVGQSLMNFLAVINPEEYKHISSIHYYDRTDIDCFFNDKLIPNTLEHLETNWKL